MISIKYLEKTLVALNYYSEHCKQNIENAKNNGKEQEAKDWEEVDETYSEMIETYTICLNQQKNQLDDTPRNN